MNARIQRIDKDIEKTKSKIHEQQARLRDLEKQKTEFENLEIVNAVRGMNISFADLAVLLKAAKPNSLNTLATSSQVAPKLESDTNDDEEGND